MEGEAVAQISSLQVAAGDRLLLCSDGLTSALEDRVLATLLHRSSTPTEACRRLIESANQGGGKDNMTAVVIAVGESTS